jgi:hypothetical protein
MWIVDILLNKLSNYILGNCVALWLSGIARGRADDKSTLYRRMTPLAVTLTVQRPVRRRKNSALHNFVIVLPDDAAFIVRIKGGLNFCKAGP